MHLFGMQNIFYLFCPNHISMEPNHLIIFIKNPVLGKVKTRLANAIGPEKALEIYEHLLEHTRTVAAAANCVKHVFYSDKIDDDAWDETVFQKHVQAGQDLGERMANAFEAVFNLGATKVIIIGSDCPGITAEIIDTAFNSLERKDAVVGPAKDGGYYLLGMKKNHAFLFMDKEWSTDTVLEDTVLDLFENRVSYEKCVELSDVDTIYDLHLLKGGFGY